MTSSDHGRPATAIRQLRTGLALLAGGDGGTADEIRARLLLSLAWAESERGRVELGLRLLDEAEVVMVRSQRPILLAQRALLLKRRGRNDLALRHYDDAVALLRERDHPLDLVKVLNNRSLVHLEAGRVTQARADLRRCGQIAARHGLALHLTMSRVNLGCIDIAAGDLLSALRRFAECRADYETIAPGRLPILAVENARALVAAGLFREADGELAWAIEAAARQRLSHTYADAMHARAEAALLADRPVEAAALAERARALFLSRANARRAGLLSLLRLRAEAATTNSAVGHAALAARAQRLARRLRPLGLVEDARVADLVAVRALVAARQPARGARLAQRLGRPGRAERLDTRLVRRLALAELAQAAGRPGEASRQLRAGLTAVHRHRTQFGSFDLQTGASVHGRDLARAGLAQALAQGSVPAIYRWSERARAQALLLPPVRPPADPMAAAALEELRQLRYTLRDTELAGRPTSGLRTRIDALQRTIRERSWLAPGTRSGAGPALASLGELKDQLSDVALVIYLQDGQALRALVLTTGTATVINLGSYNAVAETVARLRADLDAQAGRALPARMATALATATRYDAARLSAAILDPLLPHIADRALVVVPTGALATAAWSALPAGTGRPVTVAASATAWHTARQRRRRIQRDARVLLVAGPGNDRGEAEVDAIAALYPDATVLKGDSGTPAATMAGLGHASLAHLTAHGHHHPENALFSSLDLAGGPLFGYDLHDGFATPDTVVLSSCDLGLAELRPGDEPLGLATALLAAGTATVVASVARVADHTAMEVMVRYHQRAATGQTPADALAAANLATGFICLGAG
ncbi:CHAT domain-containing protein [Phytohabitans sp. LJ34]|uniref:CHAT domain-containing protein n=1 Tax=Phytohabitans sp. LJ34 TaxID=3452217 RepID=UPI003F8B9502